MFTGGGGDYCPLDGDFGCSGHHVNSLVGVLVVSAILVFPIVFVITRYVFFLHLKFVKKDLKTLNEMKQRIRQDPLYRTFSYRKKTSTQTDEKADPDKSDETQAL